jgi:hypothetical protein
MFEPHRTPLAWVTALMLSLALFEIDCAPRAAPDAGGVVDGGATTPVDAAVAADASAGLDASSLPDASREPDAASGEDAALGADAEAADAQGRDALPPEDASSPPIVYDTCPAEPRSTGHSLAGKAALYEDAAARFLSGVSKSSEPINLAAGADANTAGYGDIAFYDTTDNDGLWGSLALAAEAWRSAVDPAGLARVDLLLTGEENRTRVTGTPGVFARVIVPSNEPRLSCPGPDRYVPQPTKDTRWVLVGADGCLQTADQNGVFSSTNVCGLAPEYSGWCFKDNMSKDEMSGHVYALGVVATVVPDAAIRARAAAMLGEIADRFIMNDLQLVDWDNRVTSFGKVYASALDDFPGLNAGMALSWLTTAADATGRMDLWSFVDNCLIDPNGPPTCLHHLLEAHTSYVDQMQNAGLYVLGCRSNFNNLSMHMLSLDGLIAHTRRQDVRQSAQALLDGGVMNASSSLAAVHHKNAWYDVVWAIRKAPSGGPAFDQVHEAGCQLRMMPVPYSPQALMGRDPSTATCTDRSDRPMFDTAQDVADRASTDYVWWKQPFGADATSANPLHVDPPTGFLLPYWMARANGLFGDND